MDTTETYIKQCDCEEIQKARKYGTQWKKGDWYRHLPCGQTHICNQELNLATGKTEDSVWLPRQDQIQEMFQEDDFVLLNHRFQFMWERLAQDIGGLYMWSKGFQTAEQLWLAFYMYEKHSKIWDGEKWIKKK